MSDVEVRNVPERKRYEALVDGEVAGYSTYRISGGLLIFLHTEVDEAYEGQGVGSTLVRESLADVRAAGEYKVRTLCPFYRSYVEEHRGEYVDLIVDTPV